MVSVFTNKPVRKQTMGFVTSDGFTGSMHSTPAQFEYKNVYQVGTVEREGKKALTRHTAPGLRTLSFSHTLANLDYQQDVRVIAMRFTNTAARPTRVRFTGGSGPFEQPCWWLITDLSVSVEQRATNNEPSRVRVSWTLVEWVDVTTNIIRPKPVVKKPVTRTPPRPVKRVYRTHRVVRGDTLWGIAQRYLGNGVRWPEIFNLNRSLIKNPHWIYPGQVFKIPG